MLAQQLSSTPSSVVYQDVVTPGAPKGQHTHADKKQLALKTAMYFSAWFTLSVGYNLANKDSMKFLKLPWLISTFQMFCGIPFFCSLWLFKVRPMPSMSRPDLLTLMPLGVFHCGTHLCAVLAMSAGAVSFAHIIKSGEPLFTASLACVLLKEVYPWQVYITLIPVVAGISIASVNELNFSWFALGTAMGSNFFSSLRGVYSKQKMSTPVGQNIDPRNLYGILTIISFLILLPMSLCVEGSKIKQEWELAMVHHSATKVCLRILISGITYYAYNECAFSALELVSPVTHAVGSTFKRVFIIFGSILYFKNYPSTIAYVGISIAILGVGVYSLAKQKYKPLSTTTGAAKDRVADDRQDQTCAKV